MNSAVSNQQFVGGKVCKVTGFNATNECDKFDNIPNRYVRDRKVNFDGVYDGLFLKANKRNLFGEYAHYRQLPHPAARRDANKQYFAGAGQSLYTQNPIFLKLDIDTSDCLFMEALLESGVRPLIIF